MISTKKAALDAARRRWLHRHRHLFQPLLPRSSVLFDNIAKEINESTDMTPYAPLHQLDEQPKSVENGQMKDYQVCLTSSTDISFQLTSFLVTRSLLPRMDVSQWHLSSLLFSVYHLIILYYLGMSCILGDE